MALGRDDFTLSNIKPPGPSPATGYRVKGRHGDFGDKDEAHYILVPDREFNRPWIASPQGSGGVAFVWPLGVEGFSLNSNADAGVHHYIGDNDVDVDVVYPDELHIILSGSFPGRTSVDQFTALRNVILHQPDVAGKILALPGILSRLEYVAVINHQFNHDQTDDSSAVAYSIECIKTGVGGKLVSTVKKLPTANPLPGKAKRGKSHRRIAPRGGGGSSIRTLSSEVYGDTSGSSVLKLVDLNSETLANAGIPSYKAPYAIIPVGQSLEY